jgi:four helix bundle protein
VISSVLKRKINLKHTIMFLQLAHTKLDVFSFSQELALECYKVTRLFPDYEKFAMVQQIRRAALSVHLNIAEGCSRKSIAERKRFFEIARGSVIEIDTAIGIAYKLTYSTQEQLQSLGEKIIKTFKILSGMIGRQ